ncbi:MAG: hypothetical protein Q8K75_06675 [Chlamydiales bacterium]|nr:hypothetical protein [Chlamydiales bacterium]
MVTVAGLVEALLERDGEIGGRDDAAMDLGHYDDDLALDALFTVAADPSEEEFIQDVCGESIAQILSKRNLFDRELIVKLNPTAKSSALSVLKYLKPEWFQ